ADFDTRITIRIDGREVTVPKAVPLTDSQGKLVRDGEGRPIPRATTIHDAAQRAYAAEPDGNPIPVLCHQEHLEPAGVCRVCCVEIAKVKRGSMQRERKLLPACQHRVEETMEVQTIRSPDLAARRRIDGSVRTLVNLLVADHLPADWRERLPANELCRLVARLDAVALEARDLERQAAAAAGAAPPDEAALAARWPLTGGQALPPRALPRGQDHSSPRIDVDHDQCILCDRCVRACSDVKHNFVIGRSGKGYATHVAFDLDDPMGSSSCVSCGECMISCPTGALVFKETVGDREPDGGREAVTADELARYPIFAAVPPKFLAWNTAAVTRRRYAVGDVICREGEYASTAFLIVRGRVGVSIGGTRAADQAGTGWRALVRGATRWLQGGRAGAGVALEPRRDAVHIDGGRSLELRDGRWVDEMTPADVIFGEMSCLNHYPRSATVVALEETELLEIRRNVLHMLQRHESSRRILDDAYRGRSLARELRQLSMFSGLSEEERARCAAMLRDRADIVRVDRGQPIFRQGDLAQDFFKVRLGFVKVSQRIGDQERVIDYLGPGRTFGEIGLVSAVENLGDALAPSAAQRARRTATCTALDDVELVRIRGEDFRALMAEFPAAREHLVDEARRLLERDAAREAATDGNLGEFLENGLYSAQKLLVLDLESCTRCDECTRACSDTHEGVTRLIREGLRFENFLVASSCRSCLDPYCLVGCPVDAIHRTPRDGHPGAVEIVIESHCIGCGLCSTNCPYGNISMHRTTSDPDAERRVATTCDLCRDLVGPDDDPSCVYACPHDAAFRMSGRQLFELVAARRTDAAQAPAR
ncbi:MAG: cyclic nucleotide-binding domain-containing protein, partial [Planctomycetaceae bacterium]